MTMNRSAALMQPSSAALLSPDSGASDIQSMARVRDQRQVATSSRRWNQGTTGGTRLRRPVETPERPLLTDFPSSPGTPGSAQQQQVQQQGSNQHIYMEVMDPWRNDFYQTPIDSGYALDTYFRLFSNM